MEHGETLRDPAKPTGRRIRRVRLILLATVIPVLIVTALWIRAYLSTAAQRVEYAAKAPTFADSSEMLKRTVVVPTLDSPCPAGRNIIWCSSFQLAWNEVRDRVIGAPLEVPEAAELAARLNTARQSASDIDPRSVYAAGGWIEQGIVQKIQKDMAAKFPSHELPDFNDCDSGVLAYSYLSAHVPFKHTFRQVEEGLTFTDSCGAATGVEAFGVWEAHHRRYTKMREQVEILYCQGADSDPWDLKEYALDLCRHSKPYQVVVAMVEPKASLAETLDHVRTKIQDFKKQPHYNYARQFQTTDIVQVPEMSWRIDHRFQELIGKTLVNVKGPIDEALQTIEFRFDRAGAMLESEAVVAAKAAPRYFVFDRPFLIYMQKRGAEHPFFVMWVDNAELLVPK